MQQALDGGLKIDEKIQFSCMYLDARQSINSQTQDRSKGITTPFGAIPDLAHGFYRA
jgi:hypothetical protein